MVASGANTRTSSRFGKWWRRQLRAPLAPTVGGVVLFWLSLTPSLLPLGPVFQGVVSALCALVGYAVGALVGWMLRSSGVHLRGARRKRAWQVVAAVAVTGTLAALWLGHRWDDELRDLVGVERDSVGADLLMVAVTAAVFAILLALGRTLKAAARWIARQVGRVLPERVALVAGALVVAWVAWGLVTGVVGERVVTSLDTTFKAINDEFRTELPAPSSPYVSAGQESGESWDDLGRQGRIFIAAAPTEEDIAAFTGGDALTPVRAYVGAPDGIDLRETAERAVDELDRMGGFDRSVLNVVTGTGRGWVNENQARALEFMWAGDTATVSIQYSYLPSWMSFLVDGERAQDAGRLLFDAVYARWVDLPETPARSSSSAARASAASVARRRSAATRIWRRAPTGRCSWVPRTTTGSGAGSPASATPERPRSLPVYDGGAIVRFADVPADWTAPGEWGGARIGYLQHANDPITWWDWSLALNRPDWLEEDPGRDVSTHVQWIPVVTMLQLAADQLVANDVPAGQGHQFGQEPARAWAEILPRRGGPPRTPSAW